MAGFDLSSVLKDVSDLNTEEQLVKIELDKLDPDPENFYSLDGLDELAGNIETVGLQQPLRVRPGEGGHFIVVSGHRRRAACMLIRDGGSQQFKDGVPCIVEYGEASAALRKLRLIYANSSTRQLTSAEQSRQAEEVTRLLYELKEQGVEFPGRMRDHVAEACQLSKTKIARLHAIRENLIPELLRHWDAGEIKEETAYQLSRYPEDIQQGVAAHMAKPNVKNWPYAGTLEGFFKKLDEYRKPKPCPAKAGENCSNCSQRVLHNLFNYDWAWCHRDCCLSCAKEGRSCSFMCKAGKERLALDTGRARRSRRQHRDRPVQQGQGRRAARDRRREGEGEQVGSAALQRRRAEALGAEAQMLRRGSPRRKAAEAGGGSGGPRTGMADRTAEAGGALPRAGQAQDDQHDGAAHVLRPGSGRAQLLAPVRRASRRRRRDPRLVAAAGGGDGGMSNTPFAVRFAQELMQKYSYELGDITNKYPPELHVFCVAVMKSTALRWRRSSTRRTGSCWRSCSSRPRRSCCRRNLTRGGKTDDQCTGPQRDHALHRQDRGLCF